jgi:hypothetical protein
MFSCNKLANFVLCVCCVLCRAFKVRGVVGNDTFGVLLLSGIGKCVSLGRASSLCDATRGVEKCPVPGCACVANQPMSGIWFECRAVQVCV